MLFRVFEKSELPSLYGLLAEKNTVLGPVRKGLDAHGKPLYAYDRVAQYSDLALDYTTTKIGKPYYAVSCL